MYRYCTRSIASKRKNMVPEKKVARRMLLAIATKQLPNQLQNRSTWFSVDGVNSRNGWFCDTRLVLTTFLWVGSGSFSPSWKLQLDVYFCNVSRFQKYQNKVLVVQIGLFHYHLISLVNYASSIVVGYKSIDFIQKKIPFRKF